MPTTAGGGAGVSGTKRKRRPAVSARIDDVIATPLPDSTAAIRLIPLSHSSLKRSFLTAELKIRNPYITIAANTAPGEGVQIRNWGIEVMTHDVVMRYLRVRVGDIKGPGPMPRVLGDQTHALDISGLNVVVDHCEFAYANDQIVSVYAASSPASRSGITFQWTYIYGGLTNSVHESGNHSHAYAFGGWG